MTTHRNQNSISWTSASKTSSMLGVLLVLVTAIQPAEAQAYRESVLYRFDGTHGSLPVGGLIADTAGNLYGTTVAGGNFKCPTFTGCGVVFKLDSSGNESVLHTFMGSDGNYPTGNLTRDGAGNFYGATMWGGRFSGRFCDYYCGAVFKIDSTGEETVLYSFTGGADGALPQSGVVFGPDGYLYGTAAIGGDIAACHGYGCGVVFKVNPSTGQQQVVYAFKGTDGAGPMAGVIFDTAGNLYGTTSEGGNTGCLRDYDCGVVFKVDPTGKETVLYAFTGAADGGSPFGGLIRDASGNLYGTTHWGGDLSGPCSQLGCGVIFKVDPSAKETVLYTFKGGEDGGNPCSGLIADSAGDLYGTTQNGGDTCVFIGGCGVVFRLDTTGKLTTLYRFAGGTDGAQPLANLLLDSSGNLYGTTTYAGVFHCHVQWGCGVVFKLTP